MFVRKVENFAIPSFLSSSAKAGLQHDVWAGIGFQFRGFVSVTSVLSEIALSEPVLYRPDHRL